MGGRGGFSNMFTVNIAGERVAPAVYENMVRDNANMIITSLPKPEAIQIIIKRSFKEGKPTVELIGTAMQTFATSNLSVDRLEGWLYRLNKEFQNSRKELNSHREVSAHTYDVATSKMRAVKMITSGLKKLIREKRKFESKK